MPWRRFLELPTWREKGSLSHDTDAIAAPGLNTLPTEILLKIAEYLHLHSPDVFPASDPERNYTSTNGETCQYYPWAPHFPVSYRHHNYKWRGYHRRHADHTTLAYLHKGGRPKPCRDVINFSLTSRRIFLAFQGDSYRAPVAIGRKNIRKLLTNIATGDRLQDFVREMTVVYDMVEQPSCKPGNWFPSLRLKKCINADTLELKSLRSLDVALEPWVRWPKHVPEWCNLLPKLPALKRISLKHFRGLELHLPFLPRVTEAHFYNCAAWYSLLRKSSERPQGRPVLSRLPALRSLAAYNSLHNYGDYIPDQRAIHFHHIAPQLESLCWSHKHSRNCLESNLGIEIPVHSLKNVKRLSLCWYHFVAYVLRMRNAGEQDDFMPGLETLELHTAFELVSWPDARRTVGASSTELVSVLSWVEPRCQSGSNKIRIVDLRAVGLTSEGEPPFRDIGLLLTDYQKRLRGLGVELLFADGIVRG